MTVRTLIIGTYQTIDRWLFSRLPIRWQMIVADTALQAARILMPSHAWPASGRSLLARRQPRSAPAHMRSLPTWARDDMDDLARKIDPRLAPDRFDAAKPGIYMPPIHWKDAGEVYRSLASTLPASGYDTVFVVPWIKRGGADLGTLHHVRACHEVFGHRTLIIGTEPHDSPWACRLPQGVEFLEAGHALAGLSAGHAEQEAVLARLLIQLAPRRMHLIGSHTGWRTLVRHGKALRQVTRLYASLYCDDRDEHGRREGLAVRYLADATPHLHAVITDNSVSPLEWIRTLGVPSGLFHTVHFPAPSPRPQTGTSFGHRLLWASRLDRQKRPDLLAKLTNALPGYHWDVYGAQVVPGHGGNISALKNAHNVTLHGGYDDFAQIVRPDHLAFVYTSAWDGLPNVLLEAASVGLPIVAPDVGGIRDLILPQYLISPDDNVGKFVDAIHGLDDTIARRTQLQLQNEQITRFTWQAFVERLREIPGYVT